MSAPERTDGGLAQGPGLDAPNGVLFVADGTVWHVRERATACDTGARASHCLLFVSEGIVRRVWNYPRDWDSLSSASLAALCGDPY